MRGKRPPRRGRDVLQRTVAIISITIIVDDTCTTDIIYFKKKFQTCGEPHDQLAMFTSIDRVSISTCNTKINDFRQSS